MCRRMLRASSYFGWQLTAFKFFLVRITFCAFITPTPSGKVKKAVDHTVWNSKMAQEPDTRTNTHTHGQSHSMAVDNFLYRSAELREGENDRGHFSSFLLFCVGTVLSQRQDSNYIVDSDALITACSSGTYTDEMQAPVSNTTVLRILQFFCCKRKPCSQTSTCNLWFSVVPGATVANVTAYLFTPTSTSPGARILARICSPFAKISTVVLIFPSYVPTYFQSPPPPPPPCERFTVQLQIDRGWASKKQFTALNSLLNSAPPEQFARALFCSIHSLTIHSSWCRVRSDSIVDFDTKPWFTWLKKSTKVENLQACRWECGCVDKAVESDRRSLAP